MSLVQTQNDIIELIARESVKTMAEVSSNAEIVITEKNRKQHDPATSLTNMVNTFSDNSQAARLEFIKSQNIDALYKLKNEPLIARVSVLTEDGKEEIYYISRVMPIPGEKKDVKFASYHAPIGRLASFHAGDSAEISIRGEAKEYEILERIIYHPRRIEQEWDSENTIIENDTVKEVTIDSLREYLLQDFSIEETEDILDLILKEDERKSLIFEGRKRVVLKKMSLRDQPILDKFQDEIFRLPLKDNLLIIGPPGTGKTTTLIKRLGQKLDKIVMNEEEKALIERYPTQIDHRNSWLMFTPTELLKQYVKEAFNKEGIPASDSNIQTWDDYRYHLARDLFGILKSDTKSSALIMENVDPILKESALLETSKIYEKFSFYFSETITQELRKSNLWLQQNIKDQGINEACKRIEEVLSGGSLKAKGLHSIGSLSSVFPKQIKKLQEESTKIVEGSLRNILKKDANFLSDLKIFIQEIDKNIEIDEEVDEGDRNDKLSKSEITKGYNLAIRSYARNKVAGKKLGSKSKNAKIIGWMGEHLMKEEHVSILGDKLNIITHLNKFTNPMKLFVTRIPAQYKVFRNQEENSQWFNLDKKKPNIVNPIEIDMILLLLLKNLNAVRSTFSVGERETSAFLAPFRSFFKEHRNQVVVDEATDFAPVQLSCMMELSNPDIRSFFACGDFNQRITTFGAQSLKDFKWVSEKFDVREVHNPYRQTLKLTNLAKMIVDEEIEDITDENEITPVLLEGTPNTEDQALWVKERIDEIIKQVDFLPSVAIFVNNEDEVDAMTDALNRVLINIQAKGYRDGQAIGQDEYIRIFDIKHIKGLEFEAAFFINIDELAEDKPLLFDKFLYVGVTRASTYLGITCKRNLPKKIEKSKMMFVDDWSQYISNI